jgi:hypothetical protein
MYVQVKNNNVFLPFLLCLCTYIIYYYYYYCILKHNGIFSTKIKFYLPYSYYVYSQIRS